MRPALLLVLFAAALPWPARAEDDPACARYQDPLAYNACLASHGPKATAVGGTPRASGSAASPAADDGPRAPGRGAGRFGAVRRRGRVHMEFRVR